MTKLKSPAKVVARTSGRKTSTTMRSRTKSAPKSGAQSAPTEIKTTTPRNRAETKHARILSMLRASAGTTIAAIMTATDWQQHSVRGFLAGVVRKKLGLNLVSEQTDKGRIYQVKDGKSETVSTVRSRRSA
jgi:hypothetical protein